ncbi:VOC family protein [Nonomuraea sp. NPDC050663]|uniref:VOC family protein n=1 Tax=Nonomuraea sp. NPDC050663 TaxID=3364370 RepID=UPI0037B5CBBB
MSERQSYEQGVPCWVDLSSTDVEASQAFYGALFGWAVRVHPEPEAGGYAEFFLGDKVVAGIGPVFSEGMPSVWNTYVATDDIAATADRVKNAGGQVVMERMQIFDQGAMALFQAADGAFFSVWEAQEHVGARLVDEPGAYCWNELNSRDVEAAGRFYGDVFGWTTDVTTTDVPGVGPFSYHTFLLGQDSVAGMVTMPPSYPEEVPSFWLPFFAVADLDDTIARAQELGAAVYIPRMDSPKGPFGLFQDPQGAHSYVIQLNGNKG